mgnify:CR=1 FL=1
MMKVLAVVVAVLLPWIGAGAEGAGRDGWKADTRGVIPRLRSAPEVDGEIGRDEWRNAFVFNGVLYEKTLNLFPRAVEWRLGWTQDGLYLASHTPRLEGETPRAETTDGAMKNLRADDSLELFVYSEDGRSSFHLVLNPEGTWAIGGRIDREPIEGAAGVKARASLTKDALDYEVHVPFAALGRDAGDTRWRILPTRNFRRGTNIHGPMPYAHRGTLGHRDKAPVFRLETGLPVVQLQPLQASLYEGRPMVRLRLVNPTDAAAEVAVFATVERGGEGVGRLERRVSLPPGEVLPLNAVVPCEPAIDPEAEDEYRFALDVVGPGGVELLHTHFTWNPTENRAWLGDKLPGYQRFKERVVTLDPGEPVPLPYQRFMKFYEDLPEDHRLRIATQRKVVPGRGFVADSVQHITPVDPEGRKNGVQTFYRIGYILEHSISWKKDVRHGPEKFYSRGRNERGRTFNYVQKIVPWDDGEIRGVQRVFHPSGARLAETRYEDGTPTGVSKRFDSDGRLVRITRYENGVRHGLSVDYYARRPKRVIPLRDGEIEGTLLDYNWDGRLIEKTPYEEGMAPGMIPLAPASAPKGGTREFDEEKGLATWRDEEGRVVQTAEYREGVPDGRCVVYWPRRVKREVPYENGLINGTVVDYWENGNVRKKRPFKKDILHGMEKHFAQNGEVTLTRHWKDGELTGQNK